MRSKLFVPGSRPELFTKALAGEADALSFDLEDAVLEARKAEARAALETLLQSEVARRSSKTLIVRVNAINTDHFYADVRAVVRPGLALLNLPKAEHPEQVVAAARAIERAEVDNGFDAMADQPVRLLLTIETPQAWQIARELASAHPRVAGLQLGLGDLFEPLGIARREPAAVQQAMFGLRMAAGAAGVFAYDGAFADIGDAEGYRAEAELARRLGFVGKTCIHPSQVALANETFRPNAAEIAHAQRVMAAAADAMAAGAGAFVVDGRMVDRPFIERAEATLALACRLGLIAT
jgi:citrate lyase subunit beta / citryl-CoA lyase